MKKLLLAAVVAAAGLFAFKKVKEAGAQAHPLSYYEGDPEAEAAVEATEAAAEAAADATEAAADATEAAAEAVEAAAEAKSKAAKAKPASAEQPPQE